MNTITIQHEGREIEALMPTRQDVEQLKVGDLAPSCFGMRKVVKITSRRKNIKGELYCCYETEFGDSSTISASIKEREIVRDVRLTNALSSAAISEAERQARSLWH